ncbi:MAG: thioesterase [Cytophagales bacterium]|nr:thioesterase [Bernardetiaceae bacterium]MDW8203451.1 thioesterase [Cytophagales bacterium]
MVHRTASLHVEKFVVRANETDMLNRLTLPAMVNFLQEAANWNAHNLGFSSQVLQAQGLSWVLVRLQMTCFGWAKLRETVQVQTFPSGMDKYYCYRDYRILDATGNKLLAQATSSWMVVDLAKRQMIAVPAFIRTFPVSEEQPLPRASGKIGSVENATHTAHFQVSWHHIDSNRHTNNMYYFQWIAETLPANFLAMYQLESVDIIFRMESTLGAQIIGKAVEEKTDGSCLQFRHSLQLADSGKELIQARTQWSQWETS